jgi:hypothetical protein
MSVALRMIWFVLLLAITTATVALVTALASGDTGPVEKGVLVALIAGCLYLAARVTSFLGRIQTHTTRH